MFVIQHKEEDQAPQVQEEKEEITDPPSKPFLEAFYDFANGRTNWAEYIHTILSAPNDEEAHVNDPGRYELQISDAFGYGIYCWSDKEAVKGI